MQGKITYWVNCTAVGDTVCAIPTVQALAAQDRLHKVLGTARTCELLYICGIPDQLIVEIDHKDVPSYDLQGSTLVGANCPGHAGYRVHLIDLFSVYPINAILKPEEKCISALPERLPKINFHRAYIVINVGFAMLSRKMPLKAYLAVLDYCKGKYDVVLLGSQRKNSKHPICFEGFPTEGCLNMIDKTSIAESVAIMSGASAIVGMDSGGMHLASLTSAPIVCGYTCVDPFYRMPYRKGVKGWNYYPVEPSGHCKYCTNMLAMFNVEFDNSCPLAQAYNCATSLRGEDFVKQLHLALTAEYPAIDGRCD